MIQVESSGDFLFCQRGNFLFQQRVHASAPVGVAHELPGDSGRIIWGVFVCGCVCVLFSRDGVVNQGIVAQPWHLVF